MANPHGGAADNYYNLTATQPRMSYQQISEDQNANGPSNQANTPYTQAPPNYQQNFQNGDGGPPIDQNGKGNFDQTFRIEKPKYNDLWAGILVRFSHSSPIHQ